MMRSKEIILGLCFFHFFILMSIGVAAVDGEDEAVSESNHQKNNSSQDITENINNTLSFNVSSTTTVAPSLPSLPNDTSPISTINKSANAPHTQEPISEILGETATETPALNKTAPEDEMAKRGGWIFEKIANQVNKAKCKLSSNCDSSKVKGETVDNAEGPIDIRVVTPNTGEISEENPAIKNTNTGMEEKKRGGYIGDWFGEATTNFKCKFFDCPSSSDDFKKPNNGDGALGMIDVKSDIPPKLKHSLGPLEMSV